MDDIGPSLIGSEIVSNPKSTVLMPVPVDLDVTSLHPCIRYHFVLNEREQLVNSVGSNVPACVAHADSISTELQCSSVYGLDILWFTARGVLGDKHHWDVVVNGE